jgi:hypothetical protein
MKKLPVTEQLKLVLEPKKAGISARLFVTREDGITVYDSIQDGTTSSVAALVSGVWQASEALIGMVSRNSDPMEFRFGFDTSSQGVYLFPFSLSGKRYFLGAIYRDCLNPALLKRQVCLIKDEMDRLFSEVMTEKPLAFKQPREGFLFQNISDEEIDKLFAVNGI